MCAKAVNLHGSCSAFVAIAGDYGGGRTFGSAGNGKSNIVALFCNSFYNKFGKRERERVD